MTLNSSESKVLFILNSSSLSFTSCSKFLKVKKVFSFVTKKIKTQLTGVYLSFLIGREHTKIKGKFSIC